MTIALEIFPSVPSSGYSIHRKPTFASIVRTPPSGREVTEIQNLYPLWEFELPYEILREQSLNSAPFAPVSGFHELTQISEFWMRRNGQYGAFIYLDPDDNTRVGQTIGTGDGTTSTFVMVRTWGSGLLQLTEPVGVVDVRIGVTLNIYLNGVLLSQPGNWWISSKDLRTLSFTTPPGNGVVITADFSYFYYCRFIEDVIDLEEFMTGRWTLKSLKFRSIPSGDNFISIPNQDNTITTDQRRKLYFELTATSIGNRQGGETAALMFGFANLSSFLTIVPGRTDANATTIKVNGSDYNRYGTVVVALQPTGVDGDVYGVAVDLDAGAFWVKNITQATGYLPDNNATPTGTGYRIDGILGNLYVVFAAANQAALHAGSFKPTTVTINDGSSAFTGVVPPGYLPINVRGSFSWNPSDTVPLSQTAAGPITVTLSVTLSNVNNTASITHSGSTVVRTWVQAAWPPGTRVADFQTGNFLSSIYYTEVQHSAGELNGPVSNGSWYSANVGIRSVGFIAR
jgi:uncharacterized protein (TIGR02217 family)